MVCLQFIAQLAIFLKKSKLAAHSIVGISPHKGDIFVAPTTNLGVSWANAGILAFQVITMNCNSLFVCFDFMSHCCVCLFKTQDPKNPESDPEIPESVSNKVARKMTGINLFSMIPVVPFFIALIATLVFAE